MIQPFGLSLSVQTGFAQEQVKMSPRCSGETRPRRLAAWFVALSLCARVHTLSHRHRQYQELSLLETYKQSIKDMICEQVGRKSPDKRSPLHGVGVIVNAGNGSGGFLVDTLRQVSHTFVVMPN